MKSRHNEILQLLKANPIMKINDLCERLQVSEATVRRDLTDLRKEGVERIGGAAFLNHASRDLPGHPLAKSANQIGCIVSVSLSQKHMHPYFSPIVEGIEKGLSNLGYSLAFMHNLDDLMDESVLYNILHEKKINGMIVVEGIKPEIYEQLKKHVPFIVGIDLSDHTVPVIAYVEVA